MKCAEDYFARDAYYEENVEDSNGKTKLNGSIGGILGIHNCISMTAGEGELRQYNSIVVVVVVVILVVVAASS